MSAPRIPRLRAMRCTELCYVIGAGVLIGVAACAGIVALVAALRGP